MQKKLFFSTQPLKGVYKYIIPAAKQHSEQNLKKKLQYTFIKVKKIQPDIIFFVVKCLLCGKFFKKETLMNLKYKSLNLGRYAISEVYRNPKCYFSKIKYYYELLKAIYLIASYAKYAINLKNINSVYLDHCMYKNGILIEVFSQKNIPIYALGYPRGFFLFKMDKKKQLKKYEEIIQLNKSKKINQLQKKKASKALREALLKTEKFPWMQHIAFKDNIKINLNEITHVVYIHSFTDAQLVYGYDGFLNVFEWFKFTLNELLKNKNNKILVKAHPSFFHEKFPNKMAMHDRMIFFKLIKDYNSSNVVILKDPIRNKQLLNKISKQTILISHHGSVVLESLFMGFKCITSAATFWNDQFHITNSWKNVSEYKKLLYKKWNVLKYPNKNDLMNVSYQLFCNPKGIYGKNYWEHILIKNLKISKSSLFQNSSKILQKIKISQNKKNKINKEIIFSLEKI